MTAAQQVLMLDASRAIDVAKAKVGQLAETFQQPCLPTAVLEIAVRHLKTAHDVVALAGEDARSGSPLAPRTDWCGECGAHRTVSLGRCVVCFNDVPLPRRSLRLASETDGEPTDDEVANGYGMEGGIGYASESAMSEHDWRL